MLLIFHQPDLTAIAPMSNDSLLIVHTFPVGF